MNTIKTIITLLLLLAGSAQAADYFSTAAWTKDATAGVDSNLTLYAYSFGSEENAEINSVIFTGISGGNPTDSGVFAVSGIAKTYDNTSHNLIDSGSTNLANHFIYGGDPGTLTLEGLTTGYRYTLSLYSVGWEEAGNRYVAFTNDSVSATVDQDQFGQGEGIRIDYCFYADDTSEIITITPLDSANTFHFHGFALRRELQHDGDSPVHYVSPEGSGTWPYTNWTTAATNVQDAVDTAMAGDTVWVTNGTYLLTSQISVTNAITLQSCNGPETTILDAQQNDRVLYLDGEVLISGFTLTNGYTSGNGGGVYCENETSILTNCTITGNSAWCGGGCSCGTQTGCTISGNYAKLDGGGCFDGTLTDCTITGNSAWWGGGSCDGTLTGCTISGNGALNNGGGCCYGTQIACTISGNSASWGGGCFGGTQTSCTITGNSTSDYGGGCYDGTQTNCIVYFNSAYEDGDNECNSDMTYCCTTPLPDDGTGNISDDPCFADAANDDYSLLCTSPCVDAGTTSDQTTDIDGNDRCVDGNFDGITVTDIGAYEYQPDQTDSDGDAFSDYDEYIADTSMTNAADYFSVDVDGSSVSFSTADGRDYTVLTCTNLVEGSWNTVTNFSGTGADGLITDPDTDKPESFYRVQVELRLSE